MPLSLLPTQIVPFSTQSARTSTTPEYLGSTSLAFGFPCGSAQYNPPSVPTSTPPAGAATSPNTRRPGNTPVNAPVFVSTS
jgi:hypothetical protein